MSSAASRRFKDQQEFGDFVRDRIGMKYDSYQLVSGASSYECDYVHFDAEDIWVMRNRPLQDEFTEFVVPEGFIMVSVCRDPVEVFCNRWRIDMQPVFLFPGGQKIRGLFPLGYEAFDILLPLRRLGEFGVSESVCGELNELSDPLICEIDESVAQDFFSLMSKHLAIVVDAGSPGAIRRMLEQLGERLATVLSTDVLRAKAMQESETRRADVVVAAASYLDLHWASPTSVERMATDIGVSSRLLTYAFQDAIGLSPYQFVLLKRLHHARDAIRLSRSSIRDIAERHGFTTPSRFRHQYSRLFGELPSETRERRASAAIEGSATGA